MMPPVPAGREFRAVHYMSAVVLAELYAGAVDKESVRLLDRIYDTFMGTSRLIVPDAADWKKAGFLMAKLGKKYGFARRHVSKLLNDILVASAARKTGAYVVAGNVKIFYGSGNSLVSSCSNE